MSGSPVVLGERYELGEPLGRGGMATVNRAVDRRLERIVAVKQLSLHLAADTTAQARFRREAQASASLNHPAIASVFDTGESTDPATGVSLPYIVMELVEGATLRALLDAGPLPTERALRIVRSVLDALAHSHAMGLVHRDIKPANVMITPDGGVKVMDFGIARAVDESATSLTKTASVIGTAQYLSPEQALGQKVDLRSDLYSVGCLLFELVTGRPPFVAETSLAIAYQHVRENPVPPSQLQPSVGAPVDAVVLRALAKNPDDRYQDAAAMRAEVDRVLAGEPVTPAEALTSEATALAPAFLGSPAGAAVGGPINSATTAPTAPVSPLVPPSPVAPDREPARRPGLVRALVALAVVLILGLGAFGLSRVFGPAAGAAQLVAVPDLVGKQQAQAESALRAADLVPRVTPAAGKDDKTVGDVIDQDPGATATVTAGTTVTLTVNTGPASAELPSDLVGRPVADVERRLEELGFTDVSTEGVAGGEDVDPGQVVSVKPAEGKRIPLDAAILVRFAREGTTTTPSGDGGGSPATPPRTSSAPATSADPSGGTAQDDTEAEIPSKAPTTDAPTSAPTVKPEPTATTTVPPAQDPTTRPAPQPTTTEEAKNRKDDKGKGKGRGQGSDKS